MFYMGRSYQIKPAGFVELDKIMLADEKNQFDILIIRSYLIDVSCWVIIHSHPIKDTVSTEKFPYVFLCTVDLLPQNEYTN
jgi:hypothetical protein